MEEMKMYDWMKSEEFEELETSMDYVNYFVRVKQDLLIKLDATNWSIANCKLRFEQCKARAILETDFKELYGKDNESIRKAHIRKEYKELIEQLETFKNNKLYYENQLKALKDIIDANMIVLSNNCCGCDCNEC